MINLTELCKMAAKKGVTLLMYFDDRLTLRLRAERGKWRIDIAVPVHEFTERRMDQERMMQRYVEEMIFNLDTGVEREFNEHEWKVDRI